MKNRLVCFLVLIPLLFASTSFGTQDCAFKTGNDDSLTQALKRFHEEMAALVHGPADGGDYTQVKARAEELVKLSRGVAAANISEKLATRCGELTSRARELTDATANLLAQSRANAGAEAMKAGLDRVHAAYRGLNGALTTLQDMLDGFHDLLHPLWHEAFPNKNTAAIKTEVPKLKVRAKLILSTAESREKSRAAGAKSLLDAVTILEEAAAVDDNPSILEALRIVHEAYEKLAEGQH